MEKGFGPGVIGFVLIKTRSKIKNKKTKAQSKYEKCVHFLEMEFGIMKLIIVSFYFSYRQLSSGCNWVRFAFFGIPMFVHYVPLFARTFAGVKCASTVCGGIYREGNEKRQIFKVHISSFE